MSTTLLERPVSQDMRLLSSLLKSESRRKDQRLRESKTFRYSIDVCLKDSNAYGNIYFARYFEWQGVCRERWFYECISPSMLQDLGVFITKDAHQEYIHETFPFQQVNCEVNTFAIKQCSFSLKFRFYVAGSLVAMGYQQIVFANHEKRIARLPDDVLDKIRKYQNHEVDNDTPKRKRMVG
jgi:enediyne core biosynthesis thioesterase